MSESPVTVIAGKSDLASRASCTEVVEALRESSRNLAPVDYAEKTTRARTIGDTQTLLGLVSRGKADIAVIEAGELPLKFNRNLEIGAVLHRGNPFNVFISRGEKILDELPSDVAVSVGEIGMKGQLLHYRDDIDFLFSPESYIVLMEMLDQGEMAGFVVRAWEVETLGRQDEVVEVFTPSICMPPAGQGAVALMIRSGDRKTSGVVRSINHQASLAEVVLERTFLGALSKDGVGGIGVLAEFEGDEFELSAVIAAPDGSNKLASTIQGWKGDELKVIGSLAEDLIEKGGLAIIDMYRRNPKTKA